MKFSDFLKAYKEVDTPAGDLAKDFIASKCKATTYKGIKRFMEKHNACDAALDVLEDVYRDYKFQEEYFNAQNKNQ